MNTRYIPLAVLALALLLGGCNTPNRPSPTPPPPNKTEKEGQTSEKGKPAVKDSIGNSSAPKDSVKGGEKVSGDLPPAPMLENYGDNRVLAPRNSAALHQKLLKLGRDGELHDLTYRPTEANIAAYRALQAEALREMLTDGVVIDAGGPRTYGIDIWPGTTWKRRVPKQVEPQGELTILGAIIFRPNKADWTLIEGKSRVEQQRQFRIGLVDKNDKLVVCSPTYVEERNQEVSRIKIPVLLDVPEGEYKLQLYCKDPTQGEEWEKLYWCCTWGNPGSAYQDFALRVDPSLKNYAANKVVPEKFSIYPHSDKFVTITNQEDTPLLVNQKRIYRNLTDSIMLTDEKDERGIPIDNTDFIEGRRSAYTLTLRNPYNHTLKGRVYVWQYWDADEYITRWTREFNHLSRTGRMSPYYDVEIPPHKELHRVVELDPRASDFGDTPHHGCIYFFFIPEGKSEEQAVRLTPDLYHFLDMYANHVPDYNHAWGKILYTEADHYNKAMHNGEWHFVRYYLSIYRDDQTRFW